MAWTAGSMGELVGGIIEVAWRHSCALDIVRLDAALDADTISALLAERETDGLLLRLAGDVSTEHVDLLEETGVPYVLARRYVPGPAVSCVVPADEVGIRLAVSHLAHLGHRRIGLITALPDMVLTQDRLRGFRAAAAAFDLDRDEHLICLGDRYDPAAGRRCATQLLAGEARPSAVIVDTDMAPGVYEVVPASPVLSGPRHGCARGSAGAVAGRCGGDSARRLARIAAGTPTGRPGVRMPSVPQACASGPQQLLNSTRRLAGSVFRRTGSLRQRPAHVR